MCGKKIRSERAGDRERERETGVDWTTKLDDEGKY